MLTINWYLFQLLVQNKNKQQYFVNPNDDQTAEGSLLFIPPRSPSLPQAMANRVI